MIISPIGSERVEWAQFMTPLEHGQQHDVLIVEDDAAIRQMYCIQLRMDGISIAEADDGRVALEMIRRGGFRLVLLDVLMPKCDGFQVLEAMRGEGLTVPVVLLSNYGEALMIRRGLDLGAREYLVKSQVRPSDLSARVRAWLSESQA